MPNRARMTAFKRHLARLRRKCKHQGLNETNRYCRICETHVPKAKGFIGPIQRQVEVTHSERREPVRVEPYVSEWDYSNPLRSY